MRAWPMLMLMLVAAACAPPPDYLYVDPHVQPVRVELRKSFGVIHKHYDPVPITECGFFRDPKSGEPTSAYPQELWRIINTAPSGAALAVSYGVLPPGFFQANPPGGAPPRLEPGRHYTVECSGDAIGTANFELPQRVTRPAPPLEKREP